MICSKCYHDLREESNLFIECAGCDERYHYTCLSPEVLNEFFTSRREDVPWYCIDCAEDSDSTREELKSLWRQFPVVNYLQPPRNPQRGEAGPSMEVQDAVMKTEDERGESPIDENRMAKRAKLEVEEEKNTEKEVTEGEINTEEVAETEGDQETVKEDEPKVEPGSVDEVSDILALF